jgi:hypothetical protein
MLQNCKLGGRIGLITKILTVCALLTGGTAKSQNFGMYRELWSGLSTSATGISDLTGNAAYPNSPNATYTKVFTTFETELNMLDGYGQRVRAFVVPPQTGNYSFWIASDDNSVLYLSSDENPTNKTQIAAVTGWTDQRVWSKEGGQQSALIALQAGRRYYIEALMKEGGGGDNLTVRWMLPNGTIEEPIPATSAAGTYMIPYRGTPATPSVYLQPTNTTVIEGQNALFGTLSTNQMEMSYQWQENAVDINSPSARTSLLTVSNVYVASHSGKQYRCVVSNSLGTATSLAATLTVLPDTNAPILATAANYSPTNIILTVNEALAATSVTNPGNYTLNGGIQVIAAQASSPDSIVLSVSPALVIGTAYTLNVNGITDIATVPNSIAPGSSITFRALELAPVNIGGIPVVSTFTVATNGTDVTAAGREIGGNVDQFQFLFQIRSGDFDVQVQIAALTGGDPWAKAGLMARETLSPSSRFAASFAVPGLAESFYQYRNTTSASSVIAGHGPIEFPNAWLRLIRRGNNYSGYSSMDGTTWTLLGNNSITADPVYLGYAVASRSTNSQALASFRNFADVTSPLTQAAPLPFEPLGQSSRRTPLVISEIMYKPADRADGRQLEFIELYNSNPFFEDISGFIISGDVDYTFPANTRVEANSFVVLAKVPADVQSVYGVTGVFGYGIPQYTTNLVDGTNSVSMNYANSLPGNGGTVRLRNKEGSILLEVDYQNSAPWPVAASGAGHSLFLARPSYGENNPKAWVASRKVGGTPGQRESYVVDPLQNVMINEFLANSSVGEDYIELYNHSNQTNDLSGCVLTDKPSTNRFVFAPGTLIGPRSYLVLVQSTLGFGLNGAGDTLYFKNADGTKVLDAVRFEAQATGVACGRTPDGADQWAPLGSASPGLANGAARRSQVVINEIMFDSITGLDEDEYVELHNAGTQPADISGWRFIHGIDHTFAPGTTIPAGGFLVVAKSQTNLLAKYPQLNSGNTVGDYAGTLANGGERVMLASPQSNTQTANGVTETTTIFVVENEVAYVVGGQWNKWANEGGSSLELIDPRADNRLAANWADSDESGKAPWTLLEATGPMDHGFGIANFIEGGLMGEGECLLDNVELITTTNGVNVIASTNSTFEAGLSGWVTRGNHVRSSLESGEGYASAKSLHVRSSSRFDYGVNRIIVPLTTEVTNTTLTIRARVRWLKGWPEFLLRTHGNHFEAYSRLALPANLGTPGLPNSRLVANAGPALYEVSHTPVLPSANQPVLVQARVDDPDGLAQLTLSWRPDNTNGYNNVIMADDGSGGDVVSGDGIFTATIPGQASGIMVAFVVQAADALGATNVFPANAWINQREALVRFGDPVLASSFGTYRQWFTASAVSSWINRPTLSNEPVEGTFVYGNFRAIYNFGSRYAGSPYHQGWSSPLGDCHYSIQMPDDDKLLGTANFNKIHGPGNGAFDDATFQREQTAYWMARQLGLFYPNRRYVNMVVNGAQRRSGWLMEDMQTPGTDYLNETFPDDPNGSLYKMQPWFEMDDRASGGVPFANNSWCTQNRYTTTVNGVGGQYKTGRYRMNYLTRGEKGTANNFAPVYALVDAANTATNAGFQQNMEAVVDMEQWMRVFAIEHACGNWDSVGANNEQNMYGYKPENGPWRLFIFDFNIVLGNSGSWGPGPDNLFTYNTQNFPGQPTGNVPMANVYSNPAFRRAYLRAFKEIANGPMLNAKVDPVMDAKYDAFRANGLNAISPDSVKTWINTMRSSLQTALNNNAAGALPFNAGPSTSYTATSNFFVITGSAPIEAKYITINGVVWPVTWTNISAWTARLPLQAGTNAFVFGALGVQGDSLGLSTTANVIAPTNSPDSLTNIVFNEVMYHPTVAGASYVELFNQSTNATFDLSGWRVDGLNYVFPAGSSIGPRACLVLAADRQAMITAHGSSLAVFDVFTGSLQNNGETLTLLRPGTNGEVVVDQLRYDSEAPWPALADGAGSSLQLVDARQDNTRVANWTDGAGWRFFSYTGTNNNSTQKRLYLFTDAAGEMFIDDLRLVPGTVAGVGPNLVTNGDFEGTMLTTTLGGPWIVANVASKSFFDTNIARSGQSSLHLIFTNAGSLTAAIAQDTQATSNAQYTVSFWYLPSTNITKLTVRTGSTFLRPELNVRPNLATPGITNFIARNLPTMPVVWLNEVAPEGIAGHPDNAGDLDPWIEIYNPTTNTVDLGGLYLSDTYTNLARWQIPSGTLVSGQSCLVIWADGETGESAPGFVHADFRLTGTNGSLALSATINGEPRVLDYFNWQRVWGGRTYGAYPDGQPFYRQRLDYPTPGITNNPAMRPQVVRINEWMSDNTSLVALAGIYEDWFELYNPGAEDIDLSGWFLTDTTNSLTQFEIPRGIVLPAQGFLVLWADGNTSLNGGTNALHVNFKLSRAGESIILYNPAGQLVDLVAFGPQGNNAISGRNPDGEVNIQTLTTPTPGYSNVVAPGSNTAPVLAPLGTHRLLLGQSLSLTAQAADADLPVQTLTFAVLSGPGGLTVNPASGQIAWTPGAGQLGTNLAIVTVADNGTPVMSATNTLTVLVGAQPRFGTQGIRVDQSQVQLTLTVLAGKTYRVEYKDNLNGAWQTLGSVTAANETITFTDTPRANRFYRVVVD